MERLNFGILHLAQPWPKLPSHATPSLGQTHLYVSHFTLQNMPACALPSLEHCCGGLQDERSQLLDAYCKKHT